MVKPASQHALTSVQLSTPYTSSYSFQDSQKFWCLWDYLTVFLLGDRSHRSAQSEPTLCAAGVPQETVLGSLLFSVFTSPISRIAEHFGIQLQQYTDDTQLHIALSYTDLSSKRKLEQCLSSMYASFCFNSLARNPDKSEAIFLVHANACILYLYFLASTSQALLYYF